MRLYLFVITAAFLAACAATPEPHPWGPGGSVWWDKVRGDKSTTDSRPIDRNDPFWQRVRAGW